MSFGHFTWNLSFSHSRAKFSGVAIASKSFLDHFVWLQNFRMIAKFSHDHANLQHLVFKLLFVIYFIFFFWLHLNYLQISNKSWSKLIILILLLCIWIIINIICLLQIDSFFLSPIYQNHTLKWLQNFIKLVNNSYKSNNLLIEYFKYNYCSKDVKLMRIAI